METGQFHLTFDRIKNRYWQFRHENGCVAAELLQFRPDGTVSGYDHDNERYWQIAGGLLSFLDRNRVISVTFDVIEFLDGEKLLLKGKHRGGLPVLCLREQIERVKDGGTKSALSAEIKNLGWSIGDHTYGVPQFIEKGMSRLVIGKYCSIADGVKIAFGNHRTDTFTTFPFKAKGMFWEHVPYGIDDHSSKGDVIIGNDVWIATDVFIGSGITIGNGAIIGAKSVIVKDVPPYAIVVGNPGKVIRYRFDPTIIAELLRLAWWHLSDELVDSLLPHLMANDARALLSAIKGARSLREVLKVPI